MLRFSFFVVLLWIAGALISGGAAAAPQSENPTTDGDLEHVQQPPLKSLSLSLEDCVLRAYRHNIQLQVSRDTAAAQATFIDEAKGAYDPAYFADISGGESIQPSGSRLVGGIGFADDFDQDFFSLSTGFKGLIATGASYQVDLALNRTYLDPAGPFTLNPQVSNTAGLQISQPLLRNAWTRFNRAEIRKAKIATRRENYNLESSLNEVIFSTIEAYWNLIYARKDLKTTDQSLKLARDLLEINERKMREGIFTKIEVLEASVDVATREEQLVTAGNAVKTAEDILKRFVLPSTSGEDWEVGIETLTEAVIDEGQEGEFDALLEEAINNRADYLALVEEKKRKEIELFQARNQKLPILNLTGDYRYAAVGSNYGKSFEDIRGIEYPSFSLTLNLEVPIGNRVAGSRERRAQIELRRAQTQLVEKMVDLIYEIREGVRSLDLQLARITAAAESKGLSWERYQGELKRLKAGRSINYQVREAERNYYLESLKENRALYDAQIARARLAKVRGLLLASYGIQRERTGKVEEE